MLIIHVAIHVKPECREAFIAASRLNAQASRQEAGVAQFDLLRRQDDDCAFLLVEAYRSPEAQTRHKETAHYQTWAETVAPHMAQPRQSVKYEDL